MNNDTITEKGYLTNIITEKSIDWIANQRDKEKPFCLFVHHKACHRNWLPEMKYLSLYEDKTFALPDNFYDDYEGREAAKTQEMGILKDMDIMYDTKMYNPEGDTPLKTTYEAFVGRLDEADRKVYNDFYQPIIDEFYKKNLQGKELAEWKYQRYMRDYAKVLKSLDDNVGILLDYLEQQGLLKILWLFIPPIRDFIWENMAGLTSVSCMKSQCVLLLLCVCLIIWSRKPKVKFLKWYRILITLLHFLIWLVQKFLRIFKVYLYFLC